MSKRGRADGNAAGRRACPDGGCAHAPNPGQTGTDPLVRDTDRRG